MNGYTGSPFGLTTRAADLSLAKPPKWAWQNRIVLDALNLIIGVEGAGKGVMAAWQFARLTHGELPGDLYGTPITVGIIGDEDSWNDVWTPRLYAAGADLDRVKLIERQDGELVDLGASKSRLAALVIEEGMRVVYCDALLDNLGAETDDWRAKQVRAALAPARQLARELKCAIVGSLHPNKSTGGGFRRLVSGSAAFNALSRSSLLLAEHPEDADRRVLVRGKGNLSAVPEAVEFSIESYRFQANGHEFNVPRAVDFTTSAMTVDDLLVVPDVPPPAGEARTTARELIATALGDGDWHEAAPIITACAEHDVHERAARRAAKDIGIEQERRGFPARVWWRLFAVRTAVRTHVGTGRSDRTVHTVNMAQNGSPDSPDIPIHSTDSLDSTASAAESNGGVRTGNHTTDELEAIRTEHEVLA